MGEFVHVCVVRFFCEIFIAPSPIPNPNTIPVPGSARSWNQSSKEHLRVQPCDRDCDPSVNQNFYVPNRFISFSVNELTKIGEYDLGFLTHNHINR